MHVLNGGKSARALVALDKKGAGSAEEQRGDASRSQVWNTDWLRRSSLTLSSPWLQSEDDFARKVEDSEDGVLRTAARGERARRRAPEQAAPAAAAPEPGKPVVEEKPAAGGRKLAAQPKALVRKQLSISVILVKDKGTGALRQSPCSFVSFRQLEPH